jgi:tRNA dimethylallyltransferase
MQDKKIKIIAIVGPTASGKSAVALQVARALGGEIVSCDSMQIYKDMNIGTAKPSNEEKLLVPHHMIDIVDPGDNFSCADYREQAKTVIADIAKRGKLPILCGGTGLYLDSVLRGGTLQNTCADLQYREELYSLASEKGNDFVHKMLEEIDPQAAQSVHPNNVKRVIRALEIYKTSGMTKTEVDKLSKINNSPYESMIVGLRYTDREILYRRIDQRVDKMIEDGLLDEVRTLNQRGVFEDNNTAAQAIGYKELLGYLKGEMSLGTAVDELKRATRHYAKRQMTWFSGKSDINWVDLDEKFINDRETFEDIVNNIIKLFYNNGFYGIIEI